MKRWYDVHPGILYLPEWLEHLRGKPRLTLEEVASILGLTPMQAYAHLQGRDGLQLLPPIGRRIAHVHNLSFAALEEFVLRLLPAAMRDCGGPDCHPMLVLPHGTFNSMRLSPSPCMFQGISIARLRRQLSPPESGGSVFQRTGLDPEDRLALLPHEPRHLLITLLRRGGVSETALATVAGQVDPRQHRHYDHRTAEDLLDLINRTTDRARRVSPFAALRPKPADEEPGDA